MLRGKKIIAAAMLAFAAVGAVVAGVSGGPDGSTQAGGSWYRFR